MKAAFLNFQPCLDNNPTDRNFDNVGINSGNIVFSYSLSKTICCDSLTVSEVMQRGDDYDCLIIRDLITLEEHSDLVYFEGVRNKFKKKPIIPISVGLQSPDRNPFFKLHPNAQTVLKEMSEKAILGVRGEYTASILNKHGIKNIRVIGCPSLYLDANYNRKIIKKDYSEVRRVMSNYRTLTNHIANPTDLSILKYLRDHTEVFVEQTRCFADENVRRTSLAECMDFVYYRKKYFFIFEDWYNYTRQFDFCIGARFHGNVVPVLGGVPALFLSVDSRTKELTDYFGLPTMNIKKFDPSKPLEYYYDKADYTEFNKNYPKKLDNFLGFCLDNGLETNHGMYQYLYRRQNAGGFFSRLRSR